MGKMKEVFMDIRAKQVQDDTDDYFELISEEEFENYIRRKYGYGVAGTMMLAHGETADGIDNTENF